MSLSNVAHVSEVHHVFAVSDDKLCFALLCLQAHAGTGGCAVSESAF
jgi:hypothetical protein